MNCINIKITTSELICYVVSLQCICPTGMKLNPNNFVCEDIDECYDLGLDACINGICINTEGSYHCECDHDSVLDNTGRICIGKFNKN